MKHLLLILLTSFSLNGICQISVCSSKEPNSVHLNRVKKLLTNSNSQKSDSIRIIPVVFHVLHEFGIENISDTQILDQMTILNKDFQKLNSDTTTAQAPFDTIIGNARIEFRLATIDPNGNPTNGIDRIATTLTNNADTSSRINTWITENYYNIWVVKSFNQPYASLTFNPLFDSLNSCYDGTMIIHNYVGSIGTGNPFASRTLTHQTGHYLGLFHSNSSTDCSYSDGLVDTPTGISQNACSYNLNTCDDSSNPESMAYWGSDQRDIIEDFMSLQFCSSIFTFDQVDLMRSVLESPLFGRSNLFSNQNLVSTGTQNPIVFEEIPYSDFTFSNTLLCVNDSLTFISGSGSQTNLTFQWSFPGGSPSTSNLPQPTISYSSPGFYSQTLSVTSPTGTSTTTHTNEIYVSGGWSEFVGPTLQDFNSEPIWWISQSFFDSLNEFQLSTSNGVNNSTCYVLNNQVVTDNSNCGASSNQLKQKKDYLISPSFDLSTTSNVSVSFDYAYARDLNDTMLTELLKVYSSRDCGKTWTLRESVPILDLICNDVSFGTSYVPSSTDWRTKIFNYTTNSNDTKTRFRFEFTAAKFSNNLFIDNFRIDGLLSLSENMNQVMKLYPNPVLSGSKITVDFQSTNEPVSLKIYDIVGKEVGEFIEIYFNGGSIELPINLKTGYYNMLIHQGNQEFFHMFSVN